jgi:hypothetical protein
VTSVCGTMRTMALVVLSMLTVATGACAPEPASRDTSGATSQSPSGATTSSATPQSPPVATFEAVGRLRVGMRIREALAALGGSIDTGAGPLRGSNCNHATFSALPPGVLVMLWADTIVRIEMDSANVKTRWGAGVGSTLAEIRQRHATHDVRQEPHPYSSPTWHYMVVDTPGDTVHRIIFETNEQQRVASFRVGLRRAVDLVEGCS